MSTPPTELLLRVNGVQAAFGLEFGAASPRVEEGRRTSPYRQANVSYSLVQRHQGRVVRHTLVDCGMGVVPSLVEFEQTHGVHAVHEVLLTHPHLDHFAQLDWLSMCLLRSEHSDQPRPLPIYASRECWDEGPGRVHRYLGQRSDVRILRPGEPLTLGEVEIVPFAVDHGPKAPGALGFVVRHGGRKIVLSGDFLRVPEPDSPLLSGADVLFLDANTWHPAEWTWHQSVLGDLALIEAWRPKRAYLIHYSGYEDREHRDHPIHAPLDSRQFRRELARAATGDVQLAEHGMILGDTVPWPT